MSSSVATTSPASTSAPTSAGRARSLPPTRKPRSVSVRARIVPASRCAGAALSSRAVVTITTCGAGGITAVSVGAAIAVNQDRTSDVDAAAAAAAPIPATASAILLRRRICRPPGFEDFPIIDRF